MGCCQMVVLRRLLHKGFSLFFWSCIPFGARHTVDRYTIFSELGRRSSRCSLSIYMYRFLAEDATTLIEIFNSLRLKGLNWIE